MFKLQNETKQKEQSWEEQPKKGEEGTNLSQ